MNTHKITQLLRTGGKNTCRDVLYKKMFSMLNVFHNITVANIKNKRLEKSIYQRIMETVAKQKCQSEF